jgi:class 3 adenylate cyclase
VTSPPSPTAPRGLSLRTRWTVVLLFVAAAPLGLLAWLTARTVYQGLASTERSLQVSVLHRAAESISGDLDYAGESVHRVGRTLLDASAGDPAARVLLARDAMARTRALLHVAVYAPTGERIDTIYRTADSRSLPALERLPADVIAALPHEGVWRRAEFAAGSVAIRYVEALGAGADDTPRLVVVGTLDPQWLTRIARELSRQQYGVDDRVLVTDEGCRLLVPIGAEIGASVAGSDIFRARSVLGSDVGDVSITQEYDGAEAMVGSLFAYRRMGWLIAVRRPVREAYASLVRARTIVGTGALAAVALAAALGAWLAGRTTRPIRALVELTEAYAARRFDARSPVKTRDELETLGGALESMAGSLEASEKEIARRVRVEGDLARFLPAEVAAAVARGDQRLALGGVRRTVTVVFADVVSFTSFAESASPERVVAFLNELFTVLTEVVFRHGGTVDKFVGDCVMAVFGTGSDPRDDLTDGPDSPVSRALSAAEDIHRFVEASAPAWKETYGIDVRLGVGVNTGEALVGNLGSESRMEYTVIGDVVNVAARLEGLARGAQTLATGAVVRAAGQRFSYRPLGEHPLRGKREMVEIFEVTT